jgi:hypothetical protein
MDEDDAENIDKGYLVTVARTIKVRGEQNDVLSSITPIPQ